MRKYTTALTFNVTLSRVTTSCEGTSIASTRSESRTSRSIGRKTRITPGPFGWASNAAQPEDDASLVFRENLDAGEQIDRDDHRDDRNKGRVHRYSSTAYLL